MLTRETNVAAYFSYAFDRMVKGGISVDVRVTASEKTEILDAGSA